MKVIYIVILSLFMSACTSTSQTSQTSSANPKHLFILSGQSNMARLPPQATFIPTVAAALGKNNIIVVKDAEGGQPIHRWDKSWTSPKGAIPEKRGTRFDMLMKKVNKAIKNQKIETVTFIWMQGERDAKLQWASLYSDSFKRVVQQVKAGVNHNDINVVIGRLSDFDLANRNYKHWTKIRQIQEQLAQELPNAAWVDTDDLNDGLNNSGKTIKNDLHMSEAGYRLLGTRFAEKALALIQQP